MLLKKDELIELANPGEHDEVHQSKLFDYKGISYDYYLFHRVRAFKLKEGTSNIIIVSTNEDRKPIYRLKIPCEEFREFIEKTHRKDGSYRDHINVFFKDNKAFWYCGDNDPLPITEYLTVL